jgi:multidrug resistance efflux pump
MAEEGRILEDRTREDVAEVKGEVRQMNLRLSNLEQGQRQLQASLEQGQRQLQASIDSLRSSIEQGHRWLISLVVGAWLTIVLTILFKG